MTEASMTFQEKLDRYATLRDTIQGLEAEKDELGKQIKLELEAGEYAETELYRPVVRVSRVVSYPLERFREVFGDAAALEVASIDRKRVEELAKAGDLDAEQLKGMAQVQVRKSLVLEPR
nr:hypothetical protein [Deinococcus peraridilitoris]